MEAVIEHLLEPELTGPIPRRLRLPLRAGLLLAVAGLLLGLFAAGSARALWEAVELSWLAETGHSILGQIAEIRTAPPASKDAPREQTALRYTATVPGPHGPVFRAGWIALTESPALPTPDRPPRLSSQSRPGPRLFQLPNSTSAGRLRCVMPSSAARSFAARGGRGSAAAS